MKKTRKTIGFFAYMRRLDRLYRASKNVTTKTIKHPKLAEAIVELKEALEELEEYEAEVNWQVWP